MTVVFLLLGVVAFAGVLQRLGTGPLVLRSGRQLRSVTGVLQSSDHDDTEKEAAAKAVAIALVGAFVGLLWRSCLALAAAFFCVWGGALTGLYDLDEAVGVSLDPLFLGSAVALSLVILVLRR